MRGEDRETAETQRRRDGKISAVRRTSAPLRLCGEIGAPEIPPEPPAPLRTRDLPRSKRLKPSARLREGRSGVKTYPQNRVDTRPQTRDPFRNPGSAGIPAGGITESDRHRMCSTKRKYGDKRAVIGALKKFAKNRGRHGRPENLRAYLCPFCAGYHLTKDE